MDNKVFKKWNNLFGYGLFFIALLTFGITVEPTASFWDCAEYIATSAKLQVGHPPGAPLFQMMGAFFSIFASFVLIKKANKKYYPLFKLI